jgi:Domain of unknown function (DUF4185)
VLYRSKPQTFTDRASWQGWSSQVGWGKPPNAVVAGPRWRDERAADRRQYGAVVLQRQHRQQGGSRRRHPTGLGAAPVTTVVFAGTWPDPAEDLGPPEDNRLAQPDGGYISPGSTLDELRVFISQWNTGPGDNSPYRVIQFAVNPLKP